MSILALELIAENKKTKNPFLDLGNCGLVNYLPDELFDCVWLQRLNLGVYYRDEIKKHLIETTNKESSNIFTGKELAILEKLTDLQSLDLSSNQISNIRFLEKLTGLQSLSLRFNQISDYSFIEKLTGLQSLDLSYNQISDIRFLEKLTGLQSLDLSYNQISDIRFLEKLTGLQLLALSYNQISDIRFLKNLMGLQSLDLRKNQILDTRFLENLMGLQSLDLSSNSISDISFIEKLTGLQSLYLSYNQISDISFIEKLTGLQSLYLHSNQISDIKPLLLLLDNGLEISLEEYDFRSNINIYNNPITNPPLKIVKQGREAVIRYFESIEEIQKKGLEAIEIRELKVIFVGEGDAGKTTLMKRLIGEEVIAGEKQTQGIKQVTWLINSSEGDIKANLWDFGGQEIQHTTHQFFLTEDCIYVLVLDNRRDEQPEYWLQHILSLGKDSPILVVSNKVDKPEHATDRFNQDFLKDKYNIIGFHKVSALNGTNTDYLRDCLIDLIKGYKFPKFSPDWVDVKDYIEQEIELGKNYITKSKLHKYCQNLIEDADERIILNYMKTMGRISFYQKNLLTRNFYILNPEWLIYALYKIILSEKSITQNGEIHIDDFDEILKQQNDEPTFNLQKKYDYEREHHGYLLEMMKEYGLCYTADNQKVIIPSAFKESFTNTFQKSENDLSFYFQYLDFLPPSIISQFIVKMFPSRKDKNYWRSGMELYDNETRTNVLIQVDKEQKRIYINAQGEQKRRFFDVIRREFKEINSKFSEMRLSERIPLKSKLEDQSVDYDDLINHELDLKAIYYHGKTRENYQVSELLSSIELRNITEEEINKKRQQNNMENDRINIKIENNPHFEQKNGNKNIVNLKIDVSIIKEFDEIKELLLDLEEYILYVG